MPIRALDGDVFLAAAAEFGVWILVRDTNAASLDWMGVKDEKSGQLKYFPKPLDCKAKTADADPSQKLRHAGLVADPTKFKASFGEKKWSKAVDIWKDMAEKQKFGKPGSRYAVELDAKSPHYGCLKRDGMYLHGDYDLKDIVKVGEANLAARETMLGEVHMRDKWFKKVQAYCNARFTAHDTAVPMIQHGGEVQYADHTEDMIYVYGPVGEQFVMATRVDIADWYAQIGRQVINLKTMPTGPMHGPAPNYGAMPGARQHGHLWSIPGGKP